VKLKTRLEERDGQTVFVINRKEWMRGPQPEGLPATLWDCDEHRGCCLGLAALCEGVSMRTLQGIETPGKVIDRLPTRYIDAWLRDGGDDRRVEAEKANDADIDESNRESIIAGVFFAARGWLVEFAG
jgi:hypothetical protein